MNGERARTIGAPRPCSARDAQSAHPSGFLMVAATPTEVRAPRLLKESNRSFSYEPAHHPAPGAFAVANRGIGAAICTIAARPTGAQGPCARASERSWRPLGREGEMDRSTHGMPR